MGRRSLTVDVKSIQFIICIEASDLKKKKEKKEYVSAYMVLLSGCIFETRLTERQKCVDAGGRGSFLPHEFLHSVHS